jgi:hypothetical protein
MAGVKALALFVAPDSRRAGLSAANLVVAGEWAYVARRFGLPFFRPEPRSRLK